MDPQSQAGSRAMLGHPESPGLDPTAPGQELPRPGPFLPMSSRGCGTAGAVPGGWSSWKPLLQRVFISLTRLVPKAVTCQAPARGNSRCSGCPSLGRGKGKLSLWFRSPTAIYPPKIAFQVGVLCC